MTTQEIKKVDALVDAHLAATAGTPATVGAIATKKPFNVCETWTVIKPILAAVQSLLFLKPKWQQALAQFSGGLDGFCAAKQPV